MLTNTTERMSAILDALYDSEGYCETSGWTEDHLPNIDKIDKMMGPLDDKDIWMKHFAICQDNWGNLYIVHSDIDESILGAHRDCYNVKAWIRKTADGSYEAVDPYREDELRKELPKLADWDLFKAVAKRFSSGKVECWETDKSGGYTFVIPDTGKCKIRLTAHYDNDPIEKHIKMGEDMNMPTRAYFGTVIDKETK